MYTCNESGTRGLFPKYLQPYLYIPKLVVNLLYQAGNNDVA